MDSIEKKLSISWGHSQCDGLLLRLVGREGNISIFPERGAGAWPVEGLHTGYTGDAHVSPELVGAFRGISRSFVSR